MKKFFLQYDKIPLKKQLIIYFLLVALVPTITLSVFFFNNTIANLKASYIDTRTRAISQVSNNIDKQAEWVSTIARQILLDTDIMQIFQRPTNDANTFDLQMQETFNSIATKYQYSPIAKYVQTIVIKGVNGTELRFGSDSAMFSLEDVQASPWFDEGQRSSYSYWGEIVQNYSKYSVVNHVVPVYVNFTDPNTDRPLGYLFLLLNPTLFSDCYNNLLSNSNSLIYLVKPDGNILSANSSDKDSFPQIPNMVQEPVRQVLASATTYPSKVQYFETELNQVPQIVTFQKSDATGWALIEFLPISEISEQEQLFINAVLIIILLAALLSVILSIFLSSSFTKPVQEMVNRVKEISKGRFYQAPELPLENQFNELGILSRNIDQMQNDIEHLILENICKEKEKRNFEMQMLQSQINPHFLYNTLNTIKLMATFQGATGIENMLVSLGRILRFSLGETKEKVTLKDELGVLEDYFHIQKIRYKGRVNFNKQISDDLLFFALVPRFILQPIVENAIMHGFVETGGNGLITLSAVSENGNLLLNIKDNGQGMTKAQLSALREKMNALPLKTGSTNGGLGMYNVHNRIRMLYGGKSGLTIQSEGAGRGAEVTIVFPLELGGEHHENTDH